MILQINKQKHSASANSTKAEISTDSESGIQSRIYGLIPIQIRMSAGSFQKFSAFITLTVRQVL